MSLVGAVGAGAAGTSISACGSDDNATPQESGGAGGSAAGSGSSGTGGSAAGSGNQGEAELGAACERNADCGGDYVCDEELRQSSPVSGAPVASIERILFLGGSCSPVRATTYNPGVSCDPTEPAGAQGCGADGICDVLAQTNTGYLVGCRKSCDPAAQESGCREGYECDYASESCSEGCQSDVECRVAAVDTNDDGVFDMLGYDADSAVTCDPATARCVHPAGPQPSGQSCVRDDDCAENGVCIVDGAQVAGQTFPGGQCTRRGCEYPGNECESGTVCESLRPWLDESPTQPLCFQRCTVGAEPEELRLGSKGHGEGCREGYRCHYNGKMGAEQGVCVGGNYNDITENNVGAQCETNADCYSPYGMGYCLIYQVSETEVLPGICTIFDCAVPGVPVDFCGRDNECVASGGSADETYCMHHCKDASECPEGFACTDDDSNPDTPRSCIPPCTGDEDCKPGEKCILVSQTSSAGLCRLQ